MRGRQIDVDPRDVPGVPPVAAAIAAAELQAMQIMKAAAEVQVAEIRGAINDRSGTLSRSVASSVRRIPAGGVSVKFGAIRKVAFQTRKGDRVTRELYGGAGGKVKKQDAFHAHFVDQGTGPHGPRGRTIARKGVVPVGGGIRIPSGDGQRPQRMFQRAYEQWIAGAPAVDEQVERRLTIEIEARSR